MEHNIHIYILELSKFYTNTITSIKVIWTCIYHNKVCNLLVMKRLCFVEMPWDTRLFDQSMQCCEPQSYNISLERGIIHIHLFLVLAIISGVHMPPTS